MCYLSKATPLNRKVSLQFHYTFLLFSFLILLLLILFNKMIDFLPRLFRSFIASQVSLMLNFVFYIFIVSEVFSFFFSAGVEFFLDRPFRSEGKYFSFFLTKMVEI